MKKKLYLLPGFGEDHRCFRNMVPYFDEYDIIHVDYRKPLSNFFLWETSPTGLAKKLVSQYNIQDDDKIIGHSMGGYFGYAISTLQGNPVCMIGSYSNANKIVRFTDSKLVNHFMTGSGLVKTPIFRNYITSRNKNERVRAEMLDIQKNFKSFSNDVMLKMSILSFGEELPPPRSNPFRIHAHDDRVIRTPDQPFETVRGGHFCLVFHPEEVIEKMKPWLSN